MKKGFTLVEIMIVAVIIAVLVSMAIPGLLRTRMSANENYAASNIETITAAAQTYLSVNNALPANLGQLNTGGFVPDATLACAGQPCLKNGYNYAVGGTGQAADYFAYAVPQAINVTGVRAFCADGDGVARVNPAGTAPANRAACHSWSPL